MGSSAWSRPMFSSPDVDPDTLKEPPFDYDGFTYTWAYTTKEEQPYLDAKTVTETVTVRDLPATTSPMSWPHWLPVSPTTMGNMWANWLWTIPR